MDCLNGSRPCGICQSCREREERTQQLLALHLQNQRRIQAFQPAPALEPDLTPFDPLRLFLEQEARLTYSN